MNAVRVDQRQHSEQLYMDVCAHCDSGSPVPPTRLRISGYARLIPGVCFLSLTVDDDQLTDVDNAPQETVESWEILRKLGHYRARTST